jgi:RNA polymerase sigma-70 factor (ECF subfamily)
VENEEAIIARARHNPAAFAPLYRHYVRPIYAFCHQRLGDRELAEDATSQGFVNALAALPRYQTGSFRAWLCAIARNVVADMRRRHPNAQLAEGWELADARRLPEDELLVADSERSVAQLLSHLTPDQREIVELRLAGLNGAEIANVLGRSHGAIRAIQFRAYQKLREFLAREGITS